MAFQRFSNEQSVQHAKAGSENFHAIAVTIIAILP